MSGKQAKRYRALEGRVAMLEAARMGCASEMEAARRAARASRRREREARAREDLWRRAALWAVLTAILAALAAGVLASMAARGRWAEDLEVPPVEVAALAETEAAAPPVMAEDRPEEAMHRIDSCTITHYDICAKCCGKTDGITASGTHAEPGITCAVDPDVIPLGSRVLVDYGDGVVHTYRAEDTGGAVRGAHVDLCVGSHREALELCRRTATVYWEAVR